MLVLDLRCLRFIDCSAETRLDVVKESIEVSRLSEISWSLDGNPLLRHLFITCLNIRVMFETSHNHLLLLQSPPTRFLHPLFFLSIGISTIVLLLKLTLVLLLILHQLVELNFRVVVSILILLLLFDPLEFSNLGLLIDLGLFLFTLAQLNLSFFASHDDILQLLIGELNLLRSL